MANVYTQAGEEEVVDYIDGTTAPGTHHVAWGTGAGTHVKGSTTLFTEASEARTAATKSQPAVDKNQWKGLITADGAKTITNAGVLDAAAAGNLLLAADFAGIPLTLGDTIDFTFTLEQT